MNELIIYMKKESINHELKQLKAQSLDLSTPIKAAFVSVMKKQNPMSPKVIIIPNGFKNVNVRKNFKIIIGTLVRKATITANKVLATIDNYYFIK